MPEVSQIVAQANKLRTDLAVTSGKFAEKRARHRELCTSIAHEEEQVFLLEAVAKIFSSLSEDGQKKIKDKIQTLVSSSLSSVFEREYRFFLEFKQARHQLVAEFKLASAETGWEPTDLTDAHGGGVCEVAGFVLRLLFLLFMKETQRQIMFLDEPFSWVSAQYTDNLLAIIRELSDQSGIQFVIITHNDGLSHIGDKRYQFYLEDGKTHLKTLGD